MSYNFQPASGPVGSFTPDNLLAGYSVPAITESIVVASGAGELKRGTLLGRVTASGKYVVSTSAASDGSQNPVAVLAEDITVAGADYTTVGYLSGEFNTAAMISAATAPPASSPCSTWTPAPTSSLMRISTSTARPGRLG